MTNQKNRVAIAVLLFAAFTTFGQIMTNKSIIEKAIHYHDPDNSWSFFKGNFLIDLTKGDEKEVVFLTVDNGKSTAIWKELLKNNDTLTGGFIKDSCILQRNRKNIPQEGQLENFMLDCKSITERTQYWIYMFGLPMKLQDEAVNFVGQPEKVSFLGQTFWQITVNYNSKQSEEYWKFFFDPQTFAFKIAQYFHPALDGDSEYIIYEEEEKINGITIPAKHSWYLFNNREFIGSEKLLNR